MTLPKTVDDFIMLFQAVKEKYGNDIEVMYSGDGEDILDYSDVFSDIVIVNGSPYVSLVHDRPSSRKPTLVFIT